MVSTFANSVVSISAQLFRCTRRPPSRIDPVVPNKLSVPLFHIKLIIFRRTRRSGAARHIFTLHIIESEHLTPHAKKRVKEKIEKVCLFVQEKANFKVYKREPDELVFKKENSTKSSSGTNPTKLSFKRGQVPKNYLQEGPEKLSSRRSRRIIFKKVPKNYPQGGPKELSSRRTRRIVLREDPKNCPQGGPEEIFFKKELDEIFIKEKKKG